MTFAGSDSVEEAGVGFVHRMDAHRDALIARITARVDVGAVQTLNVKAASAILPRRAASGA